jgi:hypothetical protein
VTSKFYRRIRTSWRYRSTLNDGEIFPRVLPLVSLRLVTDYGSYNRGYVRSPHWHFWTQGVDLNMRHEIYSKGKKSDHLKGDDRIVPSIRSTFVQWAASPLVDGLSDYIDLPPI